MRLLSLPAHEILLRLAVALSFLYPPVSALFDPYAWVGYFPSFLLSAVRSNDLFLLHAFGIVEIVIALWIFFGRRVFVPSIVAALMLIAIVLVNLPQFPVLFRDVAIALAALALAFMHYERNRGV